MVLARFGHDLSGFHASSWIEVMDPSDQEMVEKLKVHLDVGESAAIALALELQASHLVIDEKKGRKIAGDLGIKMIGLVGILIEAKEMRLIDSVKPVLDDLIHNANFRISDRFYREILTKLREDKP